MSGDNGHELTANDDTSPDLRTQLDELLAAFDEIARFGREQRARAHTATDAEGEAG